MGTNYYVEKKQFRVDDLFTKTKPLHIGKLSGGWVFCFDAQYVKTYDEWMKVLQNPEYVITNEYGDVFTHEEFLNEITDRPIPIVEPIGESDSEWLKRNHAIRCRNGFARVNPDMSNRESWLRAIVTHEHGFDFVDYGSEFS